MLSFLLRPLMLTLLALLPLPLWANPAALCDQAAQICRRSDRRAARCLAGPDPRRNRARAQWAAEPWPWSVNQAGEGHWFNSAAEAEDFVSTQLANGYSNLDIGCFQLNHRWHGEGFSSLSSMFRPREKSRFMRRSISLKNIGKRGLDTGCRCLSFRHRTARDPLCPPLLTDPGGSGNRRSGAC